MKKINACRKKCIALNLHPLRPVNGHWRRVGYAGLLNLAKGIRIFMDDSMKGPPEF